jgi:hypothetical protein
MKGGQRRSRKLWVRHGLCARAWLSSRSTFGLSNPASMSPASILAPMSTSQRRTLPLLLWIAVSWIACVLPGKTNSAFPPARSGETTRTAGR